MSCRTLCTTNITGRSSAKNKNRNTVWLRSKYVQHVTAFLIDPEKISACITMFKTQRSPKWRAPKSGPTLDDRPLRRPRNEEDNYVDELKRQIAEVIRNFHLG